MKLDWAFLRSRVARRIFLLFVLCALLPIGALAIISFRTVSQELNAQSQRRLHQATKAVAQSIYERLLVLEATMKTVIPDLGGAQGAATQAYSATFGEHLADRFSGLAVVTGGGSLRPLLGDIVNRPELSEAQKQHVRAGKTLVASVDRSDRPSRIFMSLPLDAQRPERGILLGEINPSYLWGIGAENTLPPSTEMCVLDHANTALICSFPNPVSLPPHAAQEMTRSSSGRFEWHHEEKTYLASYWSLPLRFRFFVPKWIVVLGESKADVLAPMAYFRKVFPLVILMSLWVVLLLSLIQIRRSLVPLEKLQEGTRRIANRDFESRVTVTSGDEFEELAGSFNTMAIRLGSQFHALATMAEIDRAILSALDTRTIIDVVLTRMRDVLSSDAVSVTLFQSNGTHTARTAVRSGSAHEENSEEVVELTANEIDTLRNHPDSFVLHGVEDTPTYLAPLARRNIQTFLILPIFLQENLSGIIALGHRNPTQHSQEDLVQVRQLADQVAVALSNARLIEELDRLNWGTLIALARAIDAKSPWTAGHSERVTELAIKIGRVLGLGQKELDNLHRGGLLHDIGKIGIPAVILDKSGRLTEEELSLMREHPRKGARILEPIPAYADVIPIVLQHHEWYDGTGYPDGLAGEDISLGGRIFAVADVFDAITSDRPYRTGQDREEATEFIKKGAGRHFDPKVVNAFLEVMAQETQMSQAQTTSRPSAVKP